MRYVLHTLGQSWALVRHSVKVFALLIRGVAGQQIDLPEFTAIIPYLGLYTLLPLHPETLEDLIIPTPHLPSLLIIHGSCSR
jgi:hypothetical protein